jgi:hypothetical protein
MGALSQLMAQQTLNWSLGPGVASPNQVAGNFVGLASIAVSSTATTGEFATTLAYSRVSGNMASASTPASSAVASNSAAFTFGAVNGAVTASGVFLSDSASSGAGTFLYYGTLATARPLASGDTLTFGIGALTISMS